MCLVLICEFCIKIQRLSGISQLSSKIESKEEDEIMVKIKNKKTRRMIAMLMAAVILTGCGTRNFSNPSNQSNMTSESESRPKAETTGFKEVILSEQEMFAQENEFSQGINRFSYDIFSKLDDGKNIFLSPYSIATAFSMLANGADGETKQEIMDLFGIQDLDKWNAYLKEYTNQYKNEDTKLLTANSIWLSNQLALSQRADMEFFTPLSVYYHAEKKQADLSTDATRKEINEWVSENTNGMINPFLKENLESSIQMVLLNAVYFAGDWEQEFEKKDTQILTFYGANKETEVNMICKYGKEFKYIEKDGIQGVELPYKGNKLAMDILIPKEIDTENQQADKKNIKECFNKLSEEEKNQIFAALDAAETEEISTLILPKFTLNYYVEKLKDMLIEMGLSTTFGEDAVFDKITKGICIDEVTHESIIEVDEKGTEAAAVSSIMMKETASEIREEKKFIVNQPFIFVIRDVETGTILFMGDMQDMLEENKKE